LNASPLTRGPVDLLDHPGLFLVPLDRPHAPLAAANAAEPPVMRHGLGRVAPTDRHGVGLHRYCSGCAHETEHVLSARDWHGSIPSIRWPATERAAGMTICLNCGQWRSAAALPSPPVWSEWPRRATPPLVVAVVAVDVADDRSSEAAAENEGMPPKSEPRLRTKRARAHRLLATRSRNGGVKRPTG
jgi:hypothetical protein